MTSPAAFAESTISAVQATLHRYQSHIHELQVIKYLLGKNSYLEYTPFFLRAMFFIFIFSFHR